MAYQASKVYSKGKKWFSLIGKITNCLGVGCQGKFCNKNTLALDFFCHPSVSVDIYPIDIVHWELMRLRDVHWEDKGCPMDNFHSEIIKTLVHWELPIERSIWALFVESSTDHWEFIGFIERCPIALIFSGTRSLLLHRRKINIVFKPQFGIVTHSCFRFWLHVSTLYLPLHIRWED